MRDKFAAMVIGAEDPSRATIERLLHQVKDVEVAIIEPREMTVTDVIGRLDKERIPFILPGDWTPKQKRGTNLTPPKKKRRKR